MQEKSYEESENALKEICEKLENDNCKIEEIAALYEQGMQHYQNCISKLNDIKGKIVKIKQSLNVVEEIDI